jgi:hypothetical protein
MPCVKSVLSITSKDHSPFTKVMASGTPQNLCNHTVENISASSITFLYWITKMSHTNSYLNSALYHYEMYFKCSHSSKKHKTGHNVLHGTNDNECSTVGTCRNVVTSMQAEWLKNHGSIPSRS